MSEPTTVEGWLRQRPLQEQVLAGLVIAQAGWLAYLCSRGWFYQDDFTYLSQAVGHSLTLDYLKQPVNVHLTPGVRLIFWIFSRTSRLDYGPTIVVRMILQAVATVLLYRLVAKVSASPTIGLVITAVYCGTPLLIPGTLSLAASSQLLPSQICVLVVYGAHIRHAETGQRRWSLLAGVTLLVSAAFWEKTAVTSLLLIVISLTWLSMGTLRQRVADQFRDWQAWLLTLAPLAAFTAYFATHDYGTSARYLPVHDAVHLIWLQWSHSLWPAVIGAPWRWFSGGTAYTGLSQPGLVAEILGQVAFVALLMVSWRRTRWRGLVAWLLPVISVVVGEILIGVGRFAAFGDLPGLQFTYAFDLAIPTALAAALALRIQPVPAVDDEPVDVTSDMTSDMLLMRRPRSQRLVATALTVGVVAVTASSVVSAVAWTRRWHQSPSRKYVSTLLAGVQQLGPTANLYDTNVSLRVLPYVSPDRSLGDLLAIPNVKVGLDRTTTAPQLVTDSGRIVPATFVAGAQHIGSTSALCPALVQGIRTVSLPLTPTVTNGLYFLKIEYFENRPTYLTVTVKDAHGNLVPIETSSTLEFHPTEGTILLPLAQGAPQVVQVTSDTASANVCLSSVVLGSPVAAAP